MIQLQRNIKVMSFDCEATVAIARDQPEFLALAQLAADIGPISEKEVSQELLGNLPDSLCRRVIERAVTIGLLERKEIKGPAYLTEAGQFMLDQKMVLVPEEGVWRFYWINDPLIGQSLLHVVRLKTEHAGETKKQLRNQSNQNHHHANDASLPNSLTDYKEQQLLSISDGKGFELKEFSEQGEEGPSGELMLSLNWQQDGDPVVRLSGPLPDDKKVSKITIDHTLQEQSDALNMMVYSQLFNFLVSKAIDVDEKEIECWGSRYNHPVLPTQVNNHNETERRTLCANINIPETNGNLGRFNEAVLNNVVLVPDSDTAAQEWAEWYQWDSIDRYMIPSDIIKAENGTLAKFSLHKPQLPDAKQLLERAKKEYSNSKARFLLTPYDLGLWS